MRRCFLLLCLVGLSMPGRAQNLLPDPHFGDAGVVVTAESDKTSVLHDILVQPDGKIVAAGMIYDNDGAMKHHTYLVRYLPNGALDPSFGTNGKVKTAVGTLDIGYALALQADGKIVVAGNATVITATDSTTASITTRPFILRYTSNGVLDAGFGSNGIHHLGTLIVYPEKYLSAILVRPDGNIIAGGGLLYGELREMFVIALKPDGTYNNSFGNNSVARIVIEPGKDATLNTMALQPDGKLVVAGTSGLATLTAPPNTKAALARLLPDGAPDLSFGNSGKVVTAMSTGATPYDMISSLALQGGKIVAAGASDKHHALLRYQQDGTPDLTFGTSGALTINRSDRDNATKLIAQPDHKILLGGHTVDASSQNSSFTLFRFMEEGGNTAIGEPGNPIAQASVYPNPARNSVTIQFGPISGSVNIRLVDALGRVCYQATTQQQRTTINTRGWAQGTYFLQATQGPNVKNCKLDIIQ